MGMEYKRDDDDNLHIFNDRLGEEMNLVFDMENSGKSVFTTEERTVFVKKDGTGDFKTVGDAFEYAEKIPQNEPVKIIIGAGRYFEKLTLKKANVTVLGENPENTVIENNTGAKDVVNGRKIDTYDTATVRIMDGADNFRCENVTFVNSAGLGKTVGQAIAIYVDCDKSVFVNCGFKANQDTLLITPNHIDIDEETGRVNRAYFQDCYIEGNVDFIFGGGTAVFKNCEVFCKKREPGYTSYITACCTPKTSPFGFVFLDCSIKGDAEKKSVYLGRPWRDYAKVSFVGCTFNDVIHEKGFITWNNTERHKTSCYEICDCKGIDTSNFVDWCNILKDEEKDDYNLEEIFKDWKPF